MSLITAFILPLFCAAVVKLYGIILWSEWWLKLFYAVYLLSTKACIFYIFSEINLLLWKYSKEKWLNSGEKLQRTKISITQCSSAEVTNGMQKLKLSCIEPENVKYACECDNLYMKRTWRAWNSRVHTW